VEQTLLGAVLGPLVGLLIWCLPLGLEPAMHKALAIVAFMLVYWIMEPIEHGITALMGCYLFWACQVTTFSLAFSGFTNSAPWFILGAMLLGEAASRTGLAKRVGYLVIHRVGTSYPRLLLGIILLAFLLNFLIPSPTAEIAVIAPLLMGLVTAFQLGPRSNVAKGLFIILTYTCSLSGKMILSSGNTILARGIIEEQTGMQVLWSQWFMAFWPAIVLTIGVCWLTIRWLYPAEQPELPGGQQYVRDTLRAMGAWSPEEQKTLVWLLLAIALWSTDFLHHLHPAVIALGTGLLLTLPKIGVLDTKAIKSVNFLLIVFAAGALSMGNVLTATKALNLLAESLMHWLAPLLSSAFNAAVTLYWGGFLYHFLVPHDNAMITTALPVLLKLVEGQGSNPVALGMIWSFASGGKLFVYQSTALILGYSYGYFEGRDVLKVGAVLTLIEGLILLVLVPWYWPLLGLSW
jgi:anion transporter